MGDETQVPKNADLSGINVYFEEAEANGKPGASRPSPLSPVELAGINVYFEGSGKTDAPPQGPPAA